MASKTADKLTRLTSRLKVRPSLLIVGIVGGGTIIAFPVASTLVAVYIVLTLAAIGFMAWTGLIALASAAAAALLVPVVTILAIFALVAAARWAKRIILPPCAVDVPAKQPADNDVGAEQSIQQSLDTWETDGGPAALPRRRVAQRRARRFNRHHISVQPAPSGRKPSHVEPR